MEFTKAAIKTVKEAVLVNLFGRMDKVTKEIGKTAKRMDMGYGNHWKETTMKAIGSKTYKTAKVATSIKVVPCIAVISKTHSNTGEDRNNSKTVISIKVNTNRANRMDMENTHGQTETYTSATSHMAHDQAKEH